MDRESAETFHCILGKDSKRGSNTSFEYLEELLFSNLLSPLIAHTYNMPSDCSGRMWMISKFLSTILVFCPMQLI